jgi:hypothetical protein
MMTEDLSAPSCDPTNIAPCFVCGGAMLPYFRKRFDRMGLKDVDYVRCVECGTVLSHTHLAMPDNTWAQLNTTFHQHNFGTNGINADSGVPYAAQAAAIKAMAQTGAIPQILPWVDYACGQGHLSEELSRLGLTIQNYEKYPPPDAKGFLVIKR